jgi:hypothetical protein
MFLPGHLLCFILDFRYMSSKCFSYGATRTAAGGLSWAGVPGFLRPAWC